METTYLQCSIHPYAYVRNGVSFPFTARPPQAGGLLRKMHRIPATFYTKILEPTQPTTTNQQLREQTSQPPLTHHIHRAQLKLFGHILRAQDKCLERDFCFTKAFIYRSGTPGDGLRRGRPRIHWAEQCATLAWHWLQELNPHATQFPFAYVHLHRLAARRHFWSQLVGLPTRRKLLKRQAYAVYQSELHSEVLCVPELESRCMGPPKNVHMYIYIHIHICTSTCIHTNIYICISRYMYLYLSLYTGMHLYINVCRCVCYIYIYTYTGMFMH